MAAAEARSKRPDEEAGEECCSLQGRASAEPITCTSRLLTSGLKETGRIRANLRLVAFSNLIRILEGLHGQDTTNDTGVIGEHKGPDTAQDDKESGANAPKLRGHFHEVADLQCMQILCATQLNKFSKVVGNCYGDLQTDRLATAFYGRD